MLTFSINRTNPSTSDITFYAGCWDTKWQKNLKMFRLYTYHVRFKYEVGDQKDLIIATKAVIVVFPCVQFMFYTLKLQRTGNEGHI